MCPSGSSDAVKQIYRKFNSVVVNAAAAAAVADDIGDMGADYVSAAGAAGDIGADVDAASY